MKETFFVDLFMMILEHISKIQDYVSRLSGRVDDGLSGCAIKGCGISRL